VPPNDEKCQIHCVCDVTQEGWLLPKVKKLLSLSLYLLCLYIRRGACVCAAAAARWILFMVVMMSHDWWWWEDAHRAPFVYFRTIHCVWTTKLSHQAGGLRHQSNFVSARARVNVFWVSGRCRRRKKGSSFSSLLRSAPDTDDGLHWIYLRWHSNETNCWETGPTIGKKRSLSMCAQVKNKDYIIVFTLSTVHDKIRDEKENWK
jgi:hypothetical protein